MRTSVSKLVSTLLYVPISQMLYVHSKVMIMREMFMNFVRVHWDLLVKQNFGSVYRENGLILLFNHINRPT